ncbi:hypothetical protein QUH73_01135 [Labilibaculum sp. K2S]|uniref:hypothetical protein n=1 Tax=Labilibaculum sp. K2S TaxID=3056386 RepID=UPI0025A41442|nr:hypothetical protein [Labilibaculum sp. K2S]MDM8158408.1 hypothetical protein [Labilibaculum sp. K2S]
MISTGKFAYEPKDYEAEKASNSYVMSLAALVAGLPLPIINLIATFFFLLPIEKEPTLFAGTARRHCYRNSLCYS